MTLGKRLKTEREKRNWSQKYVADKIGITNTVLSNYERDYRDPDTETLKKLSNLYEVSTDYLLGTTNSHLPQPNQNTGNFFYFDKEGLTDEDIEYLKQSVEIMKERARRRAAEKGKDNK